MNTILESYNKLAQQFEETMPADTETGVDIVTFDIPLLIRLFEFMHETIEDDAELHEIVTNIVNVSKTVDGPMTMEHYNSILNQQ